MRLYENKNWEVVFDIFPFWNYVYRKSRNGYIKKFAATVMFKKISKIERSLEE